jgi:hypothetical protein
MSWLLPDNPVPSQFSKIIQDCHADGAVGLVAPMFAACRSWCYLKISPPNEARSTMYSRHGYRKRGERKRTKETTKLVTGIIKIASLADVRHKNLCVGCCDNSYSYSYPIYYNQGE